MVISYPTASKLIAIEREKMPVLTMDDIVFSEIMPIEDLDSHLLEWEQGDNYVGLQSLRGIGGEPLLVKSPGAKKWQMQPGYYGEFMPIEEEELVKRRPLGDLSGPIDLTKVIVEKQENLLQRRIDRLRYIAWNCLQGQFTVSNGYNGAVHKDSFKVQSYTASTAWATSATATPLTDFRNIRSLEAGRGCSFGSTARAYMNLATANSLFSNTNAADIAGRRTSGLVTVLNKDEVNRLLLGEDLPQIVIYNETYVDDTTGALTYFIPNNKVVVKGVRRNAPTMKYLMTRNASNPNFAPGAYTRVVDHGEERIPRKIEVHDGHNGGPAIFYPGDIVIATV